MFDQHSNHRSFQWQLDMESLMVGFSVASAGLALALALANAAFHLDTPDTQPVRYDLVILEGAE